MTDYRIVRASSIDQLEIKVNQLLAVGATAIGGITIGTIPGLNAGIQPEPVFYQAVAKVT
jgi:hypothetical protein